MTFSRFNQQELDEFVERHHLNDEGRDYLRRTLANPSRNVGGTTTNVVSDNPCPKMGCSIQAESDSAEARAALDYVFDDDVVAYFDQAPPLELDYVNGDGRRIRTTTKPDFLVLRRSTGYHLEEWKPESARVSLPEEKPGRYVWHDDTVISPSAMASATKLNMQYGLRFSDEIPRTRTRNQRWLLSYLFPDADIVYIPYLTLVSQLFTERSFIPYEELVSYDGISADITNWALANGYLAIDWDNVLLPQPHEILVFRDTAAAYAYRLATAKIENDSTPDPIHPFSRDLFGPGQTFVIDGRRYCIDISGHTKLFATDEHSGVFEKDWSFIEKLYHSRTLHLENRTDLAERHELSTLQQASPAQISNAIERLETINLIRQGKRTISELSCSARTIRRWTAQIKMAASAGLPEIIGLIDDTAARGYRGPHIDASLSNQIDSEIGERLKDVHRPSVYSMYLSIKKIVEESGDSMISLSAFYKRVKKLRTLDAIRKAAGSKVAYQQESVYWQLELSTPIHCERPFELIHIDHTLLDIRPISSISGEPMSRPWLTIAMDAYSRRVVGFWLTYHAPSYATVMMVLYDIFRRFGRRPGSIITDWGPEFGAKALKQLCQGLSIRKVMRPKSAAKFGAVLERMFGITNAALIHNLAGNTKATKQVRTLTREVSPEAHAGLYLENLYSGLEEYFFDIYDTKKHPTLLRTPRVCFSDGRITAGGRPHELIRVDDVLELLMPNVRGSTRNVDPSRGIYANYEYYGNTLLADLSLKGKDFAVKVVPFHPGIVLVYCKGQWLHCKSKWHDELNEVPEFARRAFYEDVLLEKRIVAQDKLKSGLRLIDLLEQLNELAQAHKEFWKSKEGKNLAFSLALPNRTPTPSPDDQPNDIDKLFEDAIWDAQHSGGYGAIIS